MTTAEPGSYDAGVIAGRIEQRLAQHDRHFADINGSVRELVTEMHAQTLASQRLADSAEADRQTAVTLARALKEQSDARRLSSETHWSPAARLIAVLVALAALASVAIQLAHL